MDLKKKLDHRKQENLSIFSSVSQKLYQKLVIKPSSQYRLAISTELIGEGVSERFNLLDAQDGELYPCHVEAFVENEYTNFFERLHGGNLIRSLRPPLASDYSFPRFFHEHIKKHLSNSPVQKVSDWHGYQIPDRIPCLVIMGIGLGLTLKKILSQNCVDQIIIFEPDIEIVKWSLYVVNWKDIFSIANQNKVKVNFIFGDEDDQQQLTARLWNHLVSLHPVYPVSNFFYNHRQCTKNANAIEKISNTLMNYLYSTGNYDDEINQANQSLHNIKNNARVLCEPTDCFQRGFVDDNVIIVGSGPSLDRYVQSLKKIHSKSIVVSCGSSITALYRLGIKPDIHVEWESDCKFTVPYLESIEDQAYLKNVILLAPLQVIPKLKTFFKKSYHTFRYELGLKQVFGFEKSWEVKTVTSCVVYAVHLFLQLKPKSVSLFGVDCAFENMEHHHSAHSIYFAKSQALDILNYTDYEERETMYVNSVSGQRIPSEPFLINNLRSIEYAIEQYAQNTPVFNYSNGAEIVGARVCQEGGTVSVDEVVLSGGDIQDYSGRFNSISDNLFDRLSEIFTNNSQKLIIDINQLQLKIAVFKQFCQSLVNIVHERKNKPDSTLGTIRAVQAAIKQLASDDCLITNCINRALWHYFHSGYMHEMAITDLLKKERYVNLWHNDLTVFLADLPQHFEKNILRFQLGEADPWLNKSIEDYEY